MTFAFSGKKVYSQLHTSHNQARNEAGHILFSARNGFKPCFMTLTIILVAMFLLGFVMFGYAMKRDQSINKEDGMKSGRHIRHQNEGDDTAS